MNKVTSTNFSTDAAGAVIKCVVEHFSNGEKTSGVELLLDQEYVVLPDNPRKLKHRGRNCLILEFEKDDLDNPIYAKVKFLDTNRVGKVELIDLAAN
jgi:hypothetical protein